MPLFNLCSGSASPFLYSTFSPSRYLTSSINFFSCSSRSKPVNFLLTNREKEREEESNIVIFMLLRASGDKKFEAMMKGIQ
ncbi:hypothetical protein NC651_005097 [Populus alba x Populus x berolinensis]|nr:hypothetical protein NC651_005097 [Populus alba x Populus x berolinensis]